MGKSAVGVPVAFTNAGLPPGGSGGVWDTTEFGPAARIITVGL